MWELTALPQTTLVEGEEESGRRRAKGKSGEERKGKRRGKGRVKGSA